MQRANQIPFIMISAERADSNRNWDRTASLRRALDMLGLSYKACLGHFEGSYENSFAVFLKPANGVCSDSELDTARAVMDLAMYFDQDSVLFVGPSDGVHGRRAYIVDSDEMLEIVHESKRIEGDAIGRWTAVDMANRHAYGDFTLDLLDDNRAYVVQ